MSKNTKKPKPATVGEKIELEGVRIALCRPNITLDQFRHGSVYDLPKQRARRIDAAIKRAVKDAWEAGNLFSTVCASDVYGIESVGSIKYRIERKYGVRL